MEVAVQIKNKGKALNEEGGLSWREDFPSENGSLQRFKEMIRDEKKLMQIAFCFRVNPTPLRKILENKPPSKYILTKLQKVMTEYSKESDLNGVLLKSARGEKLVALYRLYEREGSLGKVGQIQHLSRERVRQLLNKGTRLGLFEYKRSNARELPVISREKIMEDYKKTLRLKEVAKFNDLSMRQLSQILDQFQMTRQELKSIRKEGRRTRCIQQYELWVQKFGGHPSTTEMEKTSDGTSLSNRIIRLWGSIHEFRKELKISFTSKSKMCRIPHLRIPTSVKVSYEGHSITTKM